VYDNGPYNGEISAFNIVIRSVSNTFIVTDPVMLTEAQIGLETYHGKFLNTVDWSIGTTLNGSEISSGTSNIAGVPINRDADIWQYPHAQILITGFLTPGAYYFTLSNATTFFNSDYIGWDVNNGPSSAYVDSSNVRDIFQFFPEEAPGSSSETFMLFGDPVANAVVPEPGTLTTAVIMVISIAVTAWWKRWQAA
jgi:hypothetical protein